MYKIEVITKFEEINKNLKCFLEENKQSIIFQSDLWLKFVENYSKDKQSFFVFIKNEKGEIVLYSLLSKIKLFGDRYYFYCPFGPVFDFSKNKDCFSFFVQEINRLAKKEKVCFFRCNPQVTYEDVFQNINFSKKDSANFKTENEVGYKKLEAFKALFDFFIKKNGFKIASEQRQPENTFILDLKKNEDEIVSSMKTKGRYNLRRAIKKGIIIKQISDVNSKEFKEFYRLTIDTMRRNNFFPSEISFYQSMMQNLSGKMFLFSAVKDGRVLASALTSFYGDKVVYHYGASTSNREDRKLMAPYLLQFEMIKLAKEKGCKTYDFLGSSPEILKVNGKFYILDGLKKYEFVVESDAESFLQEHKFKGITDFKHKFGGETKSFVGAIDFVYCKYIYFIFHFLKNLRKNLRNFFRFKI